MVDRRRLCIETAAVDQCRPLHHFGLEPTYVRPTSGLGEGYGPAVSVGLISWIERGAVEVDRQRFAGDIVAPRRDRFGTIALGGHTQLDPIAHIQARGFARVLHRPHDFARYALELQRAIDAR